MISFVADVIRVTTLDRVVFIWIVIVVIIILIYASFSFVLYAVLDGYCFSNSLGVALF